MGAGNRSRSLPGGWDDNADETPEFRWKLGNAGLLELRGSDREGWGRNETVDFGFTSKPQLVADTVQGLVEKMHHLHEVGGRPA